MLNTGAVPAPLKKQEPIHRSPVYSPEKLPRQALEFVPMAWHLARLQVLNCFVLGCSHVLLGVIGPWVELGDILLAAMSADLDFRKNFDPALRAKFGAPIIDIGHIDPSMVNVSFRFGSTEGKADVGLATALDMVLGLDGEEPIIGLIGPAISSVALPIATTAAVKKLPQVSFSATSPLLSNKDAYPYFMRTAPPDTFQAIVIWNWILAFDVPLAICLYTEEAYGQSLFKALTEQAQVAQIASSRSSGSRTQARIVGQAVRYMPENFDKGEVQGAVRSAKTLGSRFLVPLISLRMIPQLMPVLTEEGLLGPGWQAIGSDTLAWRTSHEFLPLGFMMVNPQGSGSKFREFSDLWSRLDYTDLLGQDAQARHLGMHSVN